MFQIFDMSGQGTDTSFVKQLKHRPDQEDLAGKGRKKKREKKAGPDEAEQFLESLEPEAEKIRHHNERFDSIEQSVESYKTSFAEYLGQLEADANSLELKKDFYAKALRLIDGLNGTESALLDLKNKQLSEVEGSVHELIMSEGGIPPKAMKEYDRINQELDGLRDKIQAKLEEIEQLKKDDHETLVNKGHEQGATDANGVVGQAQAERAKEQAQRFFDETVSRFKEAINQVSAIKPGEFTGDNVAFEPPTSWKQIVGENHDINKELLANLEAMSAEAEFEQLYSDLQVAVEHKNEELKTEKEKASVFDDAEEAELEEQLDAVGATVAAGAEQSEHKLRELETLKRQLKTLESKISAKKNKGNQPKYNREMRKEFDREAAKLKVRIAELENDLNPDGTEAAPDTSTIMEPASPDGNQEMPVSDQEALLEQQLNEEIERISQLPPKEQAGIIEGLANAGYWVQMAKSKAFRRLTSSLTVGKNQESGWNKYITEYSKTYERDAVRAEKMRSQKKGALTSAAGLGTLAGNMARLGRVAYDFAGGSLRSLNPFRHVTTGALFVARGAEAGKEMRLSNQEVISKNRTLAHVDFGAEMTDIERKEAEGAMSSVAEEAWALYEKAGIKDIRIAGADGTVDRAKLDEAKQLMDKAYRENLPEDLKKRLGRLDVSGASLLERFFLKGDVISSIKAINEKLVKIENTHWYTPKEREQRKQAVLASSEKLLKDLDRMIGDQGAVDWLAYTAKKAEWTGKAAANIMLLDTVRIAWQQLPELAHAINDWRIGTSHALADTPPQGRTELPPEAETVNKQTIDKLDGKTPQGTTSAKSTVFGSNTSATKAAAPAEAAPVQSDGRGGGTQENQGSSKGSAPAREQVPAAKPGSTPNPAVFNNTMPVSRPAPTAERAPLQQGSQGGGTQESQGSSKGSAPVQEQTSSAKRAPAPAAAPAHPEPAAKPSAAAEAKVFDPSKHFSEEAVVRKGDGVIRVLKRQIVESPEEFGFKGDANDDAAVERFAATTAAKVAAENGYWNRETGEEVRLATQSIGRTAYVLERSNDGKLTVHEFSNNKPGQALFQKEESHASGSAFEGKGHEKYEYLYKAAKAEGAGHAADRLAGGSPAAESVPPEMRELLAQKDGGATDLAKDPHGVESEAAKLARARYAELAHAVGKDANGNLLIKDTEIAKVINFNDGISPDEKAKLDFWKEHVNELKTGSQAKEFFGLAERVYAGKPRIEYSGHLLQAYGQMPEEVKAFPGRAAGYLKIFGKVGYGDTVREGVKEMLGLSHIKEFNYKVVLRPDGVVVVEDVKLPGAKHAVDVYMSHDKIGMMQPNSFMGMGRWDFWKGDLGVKGGQPTLSLDAKNLRQLTHNIHNIDNLNELNDRRFARVGREGRAGQEKEIKMIPSEPEPEVVSKAEAKAATAPDQAKASGGAGDARPAAPEPAAKVGIPADEKTPAQGVAEKLDAQKPTALSPEIRVGLDKAISGRQVNFEELKKYKNEDIIAYYEQRRGAVFANEPRVRFNQSLEALRNGTPQQQNAAKTGLALMARRLVLPALRAEKR